MLMQMTDEELVGKCLEGNQDAFAELVTRYKKLIFKVVNYYIKDNEEINDISQEVFLKIYRALGSYNPQYRFATWSAAIARNLCLDYIRRKKVHLESLDDYQNSCRDCDTPEFRYIQRERRAEISGIIDKLPEKYRTLIILYHHKGLSYKEMAEKLGEPISIIKNRLYRARLSLRESMTSAGVV